tara:strand:- start:617 stop:922 length:306 start_codon:yes stop_codon:yes gene_type:complete
MNITLKTSDDKNTKHVTVDVGNTRRRGDQVRYRCDDIEVLIREKLDLNGYTLTEGPRELSKKGQHSGIFTFVQNKPAAAKVKKSEPKKTVAKTTSRQKNIS